MMCPPFLLRIAGNAALITLTGPKKLLSNCSRPSVRVRAEMPSSSTVPIKASLDHILLAHFHFSFNPNLFIYRTYW